MNCWLIRPISNLLCSSSDSKPCDCTVAQYVHIYIHPHSAMEWATVVCLNYGILPVCRLVWYHPPVFLLLPLQPSTASYRRLFYNLGVWQRVNSILPPLLIWHNNIVCSIYYLGAHCNNINFDFHRRDCWTLRMSRCCTLGMHTYINRVLLYRHIVVYKRCIIY